MGKLDRVKQSTIKHGRRKFSANRYTKKSSNKVEEKPPQQTSHEEAEEEQPQQTHPDQATNLIETGTTEESNSYDQPKRTPVSFSKVQHIQTDTPKQADPRITGYRIVDVELLSDVIEILCCPTCKMSTLRLHENFSKKKGLASILALKCENCNFEKEFSSSRQAGKGYDINRRILYSMRSLGQGYSGIEKFTTHMNLPPPMTQNNYDKLVKTVEKAVHEVAEDSMKDAADELRGDSPQKFIDVDISGDGSWQRRGYSSFNGTFTTISLQTGKILDIEVMSRYCKACALKEDLRKTDQNAYDKWMKSHQAHCKLNHIGSAGAMEITGVTRIFNRSIEKRGLRYTKFLGDGDSKAYDTIQSFYPGKTTEKLECVGHVQKRVGTRLRNLKKTVKNIGGKGKLTDKIIDRLQNYYGIAVRSNVGDAKAMKTAIHASLFHVASSKENNYHHHCPDGENSWCRFKSDKATGLSTYKPGAGLPKKIIYTIRPIYEDLSNSKLLDKCVHGKTQNQNESFNSLIWERLPKATYVSLTNMKLGSYDAVAHFNMGKKSSILVFEKLGMVPGRYMVKNCNTLNRKRLFKSNYKSNEQVRLRRKKLRGKKKSASDKLGDKEGCMYASGAF